jgi:hypothetical protein
MEDSHIEQLIDIIKESCPLFCPSIFQVNFKPESVENFFTYDSESTVTHSALYLNQCNAFNNVAIFTDIKYNDKTINIIGIKVFIIY